MFVGWAGLVSKDESTVTYRQVRIGLGGEGCDGSIFGALLIDRIMLTRNRLIAKR